MAISVLKRTQHCTLCKNHGFNTPKKGHQCLYVDCLCVLCKLTKKAQVAMRHQQRVWRHQKQKLKSQKIDIEDISNHLENRSSKSQACDKCRNHNILTLKRNHQCRYMNCNCEYCSLTFKRREIMKHQQRVRRSKITTQVDSDMGSEESCGQRSDHQDRKEYVYLRHEEAQNNHPENHTAQRENTEVPGTLSSKDKPSNKKTEKDGSIICLDNLSLRNGVIENTKSHLYHQPYLTHLKSPSPQRIVHQEPIKESPPSTNEVLLTQTSSPPHFSPIVMQSVSSSNSHYYQHEKKVNNPSDSQVYSCSSTHYEPFHDKYEDSRKISSPMDTQIDLRGTSPTTPSLASSISSFQALSLPPSSSLHRLAALNASLQPTVSSTNFFSPMEAFSYGDNKGLFPPTLIGPPFKNISKSTAFLLHHQQLQPQQSQQKQNMTAFHRKQSVCPPPLNMIHTDSFQSGFWSQMLFPFSPINLNFSSKNPIEPSFEQYPEIERHSRFPH